MATLRWVVFSGEVLLRSRGLPFLSGCPSSTLCTYYSTLFRICQEVFENFSNFFFERKALHFKEFTKPCPLDILIIAHFVLFVKREKWIWTTVFSGTMATETTSRSGHPSHLVHFPLDILIITHSVLFVKSFFEKLLTFFADLLTAWTELLMWIGLIDSILLLPRATLSRCVLSLPSPADIIIAQGYLKVNSFGKIHL